MKRIPIAVEWSQRGVYTRRPQNEYGWAEVVLLARLVQNSSFVKVWSAATETTRQMLFLPKELPPVVKFKCSLIFFSASTVDV